MLAGGGTSFDPEMFRIYAEHYASCDPYSQPLLRNPTIGVISGEQLVDRGELSKTEVYNDFLKPHGLESTTVVMCSYRQQQIEALSLWRGPTAGTMDADGQQLLRMLVPHLQTALRLRADVIQHQAAEALSGAALEAISAAVFLVTADNKVSYMNPRGATYVSSGEALRVCDGKLFANDRCATAQLEKLVQSAAAGPRNGQAQAPGGAIRVPKVSRTGCLNVTVVPAPCRIELAARERSALVFVSEPDAAPASRAETMRQLYHLTPTEGRMADLLLGGLDVREAAERLRITLDTARFHLKRILSKTGARRQAQLIRLMMLPGRVRDPEQS